VARIDTGEKNGLLCPFRGQLGPRPRVGTGAPKNVKICPKLWLLATGSRHNEHNSDEIWPVSVDLGSAVAHQIRPSSVKGGRYRSPPKCQNLPKIVFFWPAEADTMNILKTCGFTSKRNFMIEFHNLFINKKILTLLEKTLGNVHLIWHYT